MDSSEEIELPDLLLGPIRYSIGTAFQVLRQGTREKLKARHHIQTTLRTSERYVVLSNDEKIILTKRKKIKLPAGIDGALRKLADGSFSWIAHRQLEQTLTRIEDIGLKSLAQEVASDWPRQFSYKAEKLDEDGNCLPGNEGLR